MNATRHLGVILIFAGSAGLGIPCRAGVADEVRAAFERFVQVQNTHDSKALEGLLLDSGDFLWITRGTAIWGREAALQRFAQNYQGTWKLDPEWAALRITPIGADAAQLFVPVQFTVGAAGQPSSLSRFYINELFVRTGSGWRVISILPVPAPAP
jgi:hypothetical protein